MMFHCLFRFLRINFKIEYIASMFRVVTFM